MDLGNGVRMKQCILTPIPDTSGFGCNVGGEPHRNEQLKSGHVEFDIVQKDACNNPR
jgi:hypothetical protein